MNGFYAAGWVKTGPKGLLANTISNCEETISSILRDIKGNELKLKECKLLNMIVFICV